MKPELRGPDFRISEVLHDAWAYDPKLWTRDRMGVAEDFAPAVTLLFELLLERRSAFAVAGGMAMLKYFEGRNTKDLDLLMASWDLLEGGALPELEIRERGDHFVRGRFAEVSLDLLLTSDPLFAKVLRSYVAPQEFKDLPGRPIPCATVEGLLLLKLYALPSLYRQGQFLRIGLYENDIASLLHVYQPEIAPLLAELGEHLSASDLAEVRKLVPELGRRFERRFERPPEEVSEGGPGSADPVD